MRCDRPANLLSGKGCRTTRVCGWLLTAIFGISIAALVPAVGPCMRESDQASLLDGAVRLARGLDSPLAANFYNYDKQYGTYWLVAAAIRIWPAAEPVVLGNVVGFLSFWAGAAAMAFHGRRHFPTATAISACLLAPAIWLHTPFLASASVSGGLLLGASSLLARRQKTARWAAAALVAAAVACRADALLVLPWMAWAHAPGSTLRAAFRSAAPWILLAGMLAALFGRGMARGGIVDLHAPFFFPKLFLAYTVFGLGAAALVLGIMAIALARLCRKHAGRSRWKAGFYATGLVALLLPIAYYGPQFFSPRYWMPTLVALMIGLSSRRVGRVFVGFCSGARGRIAIAAMGTAAILPLFAGVHVPFPEKPRAILDYGTLFPTPDGLQPMGGTFWHLREISRGEPVDHNHATWLAARGAHYIPDESGRVPVLNFSLRSYVRFAVTLQGLESHVVGPDAPVFYCDARDLLRKRHIPEDRYSVANNWEMATHVEASLVGASVKGYRILRVSKAAAPDPAWLRELLLSQVAQGNELLQGGVIAPGDILSLPFREHGKVVVLHAESPFAVQIQSASNSNPSLLCSQEKNGLHFLLFRGREWSENNLRVVSGVPAWSSSVLPEYMSVGKL